MISIKNLRVGYQDKELFFIESLKLDSYGAVALMGDNGSGKTTLLKMLAGLMPINKDANISYQMPSGKKQDIGELSLMQMARLRSYMPTQRPLFSHLKVSEIFQWSQLTTPNPNDDYINIFKVAPFLDVRLSELSDGQQQRVLLARAFIQQTPYLFLDEPTSFLDFNSKNEVLDLIQNISIEHKKIILYCSHDWHWIQENSCPYLMLKDGRLVAHHLADR